MRSIAWLPVLQSAPDAGPSLPRGYPPWLLEEDSEPGRIPDTTSCPLMPPVRVRLRRDMNLCSATYGILDVQGYEPSEEIQMTCFGWFPKLTAHESVAASQLIAIADVVNRAAQDHESFRFEAIRDAVDEIYAVLAKTMVVDDDVQGPTSPILALMGGARPPTRTERFEDVCRALHNRAWVFTGESFCRVTQVAFNAPERASSALRRVFPAYCEIGSSTRRLLESLGVYRSPGSLVYLCRYLLHRFLCHVLPYG